MAGQYEDGAVDRIRIAASGRIFIVLYLRKSPSVTVKVGTAIMLLVVGVSVACMGSVWHIIRQRGPVKATTNLRAA